MDSNATQNLRKKARLPGGVLAWLYSVLARVAQAYVYHSIRQGQAGAPGCRDMDLSLVLMWGCGVAGCFFQFLFSKTEEDPTWVPSLPVLSSWTPSPGSLSLTEGPGQVCPVGHTKPPYSPWVGGIVEHQG